MKKPSVVIADDDALFAALCREALADRCRVVAVARDGEEAIALVREKKADVLLLDVALPKLDGPDVVYALKSKENFSKVRIIVLTCFLATPMYAELYERGVAYVMMKPINFSSLIERIEFFMKDDFADSEKNEQAARLQIRLMGDLSLCGFKAGNQGTAYFCSGILLMLHAGNPGSVSAKWLYAGVAKEYHKSAACVERAMRYALEQAWQSPLGVDLRMIYRGAKPAVFRLVAELALRLRARESEQAHLALGGRSGTLESSIKERNS